MATERTVLVRLKADVADYIRGMTTAAMATRTLFTEVDRTNDRMAWMAQSLMAIGPALAPIGAAVVPAISGLATQATLAAAAAGVAALAFVGVGNGLKALNDYQLKPTAENLAKVSAEFEKLGPSGTQFVQYLDSITTELDTLQNAARDGLFPGVQAGIEAMMSRLPQVRDIISEIASAMGDLIAEGGQSLASSRFTEFFDYMERTARPMLEDMGHTLGNFVDGLAKMIVAFDPLTQRFSDGFLGMSRDFAVWADGLDSNRSFQDFVAYVNDSIPKVKDFVGSLVDALVQLAEAASPVGDVMLPILSDLLEIFARLVDTPLGSVFLGLAAAMGLYGRAMALAEITTGKMLSNLLPATGAMIAQRGAIMGNAAALGKMTMAMLQASDAQIAVWGPAARGAAMAFAKSLAPVAGGIGLMLAAFTDLDDKAGLSNTAMFGFAGMMAGPWAAAIGAGAGLALDFAAANNDVRDSIDAVSEALKSQPGAFQANSDLITQMTADFQDFREKAEGGTGVWDGFVKGITLNGPAITNAFEEIFGTSEVDEQRQAILDLQDTFERQKQAVSDLANEVQNNDQWVDYTDNLRELESVTNSLQPALDHFGISIQDLGNADPRLFQIYVQSIKDYVAESDSVAGRTQSVADAIAGLDDELLSTSDSASELAAAMQALLGPALGAEEATDAWKTALRDMRVELEKNKKTFEGFSADAIENRELTRGVLEDTLKMLSARAEVGASAQQIAKAVMTSRDAFIQEGVAAGFSQKEMVKRANAIGLTPKLVKTVFEAAGIDIVAARTRGLVNQIEKLPKQVQVELRQKGYDVSRKEIDDLKKRYDLTPEEVKTILKAQDNASAVIKEVDKRAQDLHNRKTEPKITADASDAYNDIFNVTGQLRHLDGQTATTYIRTIHETVNKFSGINPFKSAGGGTVPGERYPYGDKVFAMLAPGEEVITNRRGEADRFRADRAAGRIPHYADGGTVYTYARRSGSTIGDDLGASAAALRDLTSAVAGTIRSTKSWDTAQQFHEHKLKDLNKALEDQTTAVQDARSALQQLRQDANAFGQSVASNFTGDQWYHASSENGMTALSALRLSLTNQTASANAFEEQLRLAQSRGLSGALFQYVAQSGDYDLASQIAAEGRAAIHRDELLYRNRNQAAASVGTFARDTAYSAELKEAAAERRAQTAELRQLRAAVKRQEKIMAHLDKTGPERTGDAVGKRINSSAANGRRRRNP